jgi:hypothetical protein
MIAIGTNVLVGLPQVTLEDAPAVADALTRYERGMDLADALHLSSAAKAEAFYTLDARPKKRAGKQANVRPL